MWSLNSRLTLTKIQIQYSLLYSNATFKSNDFRILIFICNTCSKKIRILGKHWCSDSCIYITGNDLCVCTIILKVSVKKLVQRNYQYRPIRINVIYTHCCIRITTNYQIENLQYVNLKIDSQFYYDFMGTDFHILLTTSMMFESKKWWIFVVLLCLL